MKRFGFTWGEMTANNAKLVRVIYVSEFRKAREE